MWVCVCVCALHEKEHEIVVVIFIIYNNRRITSICCDQRPTGAFERSTGMTASHP